MVDTMLVLMRIEELEGKVGDLYEWLSELFKEEKEVSSFFARLTSDEKQHKELAAYQIRVVRKNRSMFPEVDVDLKVIEDELSKVGKFRDSSPTLESALRFALQIEKSLCEQYFKDVLKQSNKEVSALIDNLARACKDHYRDVLEMARKYGIEDTP